MSPHLASRRALRISVTIAAVAILCLSVDQGVAAQSCGTCVSGQMNKQTLSGTYKVCVPVIWNDNQLKGIEDGLKYAQRVLNTSGAGVTLVYSNADSGCDIRFGEDPFETSIARMHETPPSGRGTIIGVNSAYLRPGYSEYTENNNRDFWGNVGAHELLHAADFAHPTNGNCGAFAIMNSPLRSGALPAPTAALLCSDMDTARNKYGSPGGGGSGSGEVGECPDEVCAGGGAPDGSSCSPYLEFFQVVTAQNCYSICPNDSAPQLYNDDYNPCIGRWTSELCYMASGGQICPTVFQSVYTSGGDGGSGVFMYSHSAVRNCSNYSEDSPVYKRTSMECLSHCETSNADACEWAANGNCYVEHGSGCTVEFGYVGWAAYVLNPAGGGSGDPQGRWKDDGNGGCYWDPNDDGPDQCQPTLAASLVGNGVGPAVWGLTISTVAFVVALGLALRRPRRRLADNEVLA